MAARGSLPRGVGLGLRWEFLEEVLAAGPLDVAFFEVSPENYMRRGGYYPAALEQLADRYPLVTHGLALSIGAEEPPDPGYVRALRRELDRVGAPHHSDHLCFSSAGPVFLHELLPLQFHPRNVDRVVDRLLGLRDALDRPVAIENITYYAHPGEPHMTEAEFVTEVVERSSAGLLLDVNNVLVNAMNHGFDALRQLDALPLDRVVEIHVAGHTRVSPSLVLDTHGEPVPSAVIDLLEAALARTGPVPVLLERDNHVPPLAELLAEVSQLSRAFARATGVAPERHG